MVLKSRILKLEQVNKPADLIVIALNEGETEEEACQRCFSDGTKKPKVIIYVNEQDIRL